VFNGGKLAQLVPAFVSLFMHRTPRRTHLEHGREEEKKLCYIDHIEAASVGVSATLIGSPVRELGAFVLLECRDHFCRRLANFVVSSFRSHLGQEGKGMVQVFASDTSEKKVASMCRNSDPHRPHSAGGADADKVSTKFSYVGGDIGRLSHVPHATLIMYCSARY
jgi:hypothetical protein